MRGAFRLFARLIATVAILCIVSGHAAFSAATAMDWSSVVQQALPAIVNISVETLSQDPSTGAVRRNRDLGTGFFISDDGLILTNRHVVQGAYRIVVRTADGIQRQARLIGAGKFIDLAVLKLNTDQATPFLKFAQNDAVRVGDPLLVVGNPLGLGTSVSSGIVSALDRNLMNSPFDDYIQTDAAINHGNSGGPVLDRDGNVVGVATILVTEAAGQGSNGLGFAIPAREASQVVSRLVDPQSTPIGWIGVHLQDVGPDLVLSLGLSGPPTGAVVTQIDPGSPAEHAGLQTGDVILRFGDTTAVNARALMWEIVTSGVNQQEPTVIERQGKTMTVSVMVREWPNLRMPRDELLANPALAEAAQSPDLGLVVSPITPAAQQLYGISATQGVVVVGVNPASEAASVGVGVGDVIVKVQDTPVATPDDVFRRLLELQKTRRFVTLLVMRKSTSRWIAVYTGSSINQVGTEATAASP